MLSLSDIVNVKVGIGRGVFEAPGATVIGGKKPSFNLEILKLFANGEQGFWYDPSDMGTMFQDAAGTVPVTGVGQAVGLIRDKSGRNNHAFQTNAASRPLLQRNATTGAYYLAFDGSDDFLVTSSIDFTATDKVSLFAGVRKLSDASRAVLLELGSTRLNTFRIEAPTVSTASYAFNAGATTVTGQIRSGFAAPISNVLTMRNSISTSNLAIRIDGVEGSPVTVNQGGGNFGNSPLYVGRRDGTTLPFSGHIYNLIGIGRLTTESETAAIEKELAKRIGVTLSV